MIPPVAAPHGAIVNVYLPLLSLSLGYVQIQGVWGEVQPPVLRRSFKPKHAPRVPFKPSPRPRPEVWTTRKS